MEPERTSPNRILKFGKFMLSGLVVVLTSYIFLYPQLFRCEIIGLSDFQPLAGQVFLAPEIPVVNRKWVIEEIGHAKSRIDSMYEGQKARPTFIICASPEQYQQYCSSTEGAGCSLGTPWGNSYVIVNLNGVNTDVISHELSHAELLARLGWWDVTFKVPQWFNEGLALMVDRRFVAETNPFERYRAYMDAWLYQTRGAQVILELDEIRTLKDFFRGNSNQVMTAYMTAGMEVSYWFTNPGGNQLQLFLEKMASGSSFDEAYAASGETRFEQNLPLNPLRRKPLDM